uniref:Uncharacterized protein n=1 Tax=Plectus sambesii TaxID=2011161 RepID=A0A914VTL6_9BILA
MRTERKFRPAVGQRLRMWGGACRRRRGRRSNSASGSVLFTLARPTPLSGVNRYARAVSGRYLPDWRDSEKTVFTLHKNAPLATQSSDDDDDEISSGPNGWPSVARNVSDSCQSDDPHTSLQREGEKVRSAAIAASSSQNCPANHLIIVQTQTGRSL